jgi:hypothetical protein
LAANPMSSSPTSGSCARCRRSSAFANLSGPFGAGAASHDPSRVRRPP